MKKHKKEKSSGAWLYGLNPVLEALKAGGGRVETVYLAPGRKKGVELLRQEAKAAGVAVKVMHDASFFDSRFPKGHQGVAAQVAAQSNIYELDDLLEIPGERGGEPFFVVLDQLEDPRNLGAVLRSAEAAGVHGVVMQERRQTPLGPAAVKASAGASEHVPLCVLPNIKHALHLMKEQGITIVGTEAGDHPAPWEAGLSGAVALVIGSEGSGLRRTVAEKCDILVSIPMRGKVSSLNASVAAGVLLFEILRQKSVK
jgi:23S rRNA (guanosine2251-2'-O)-methyltransferase